MELDYWKLLRSRFGKNPPDCTREGGLNLELECGKSPEDLANDSVFWKITTILLPNQHRICPF
ncbi:MAG: hypothetical protein Ct9H90mP14_3170 [Methanobacteriota archaeon]|nr:MAG: hypothetical protein Ct9H90mP14_3170 [Euryarchaeota archaeon]